MLCNNCGKEITEGMSSCQHCGQTIVKDNTSAKNTKKVGGFWSSMQDTVKNMGESLNKAMEEGKKRQQQEEQKKLDEEKKWVPDEVKNRFFIKEDIHFAGISTHVIVDKKTGVNYLFVDQTGHAGGMTVLVDANGKPIVTK